jgi:hypothetical protein
MSAPDYSQMTTDSLIQHFIDEANHIGSPLDLGALKVPYPSAEFTCGKDTLHAIAAELRSRKPIAQLRSCLFENKSSDVRGWAGPKFIPVDPDWAEATTTGLFHDLTTQEVLAWRDRVLRGPPQRPTLSEMSIPQLLDRFVDACERCYGATRFLTDEQGGGADMKAYNKVSGEPYAIAEELNARGELNSIVPFLDHPCVTVREKAAMYCLDVATEKAIATLQAIDGVDSRHEAVEGSTMLSLWRMGEFRPPSE